MPVKPTEKNRYKLFFIIYALVLVVIAFFRFPDVRNELKYFVITDQIIQSKNYVVMHYFNELYPDKPPIYFWILTLIRVFFKDYFYSLSLIFGSIIPAGVLAFINFKLVKNFWNEKMAYIVTGIYITLPYILGVSMVLRMDFLMSMFITLAIYLFFSFYYEKTPIKTSNLIIFYLSIALGVLVKGGAAIAIPVITILTFLILQKDLKFLKKLKCFRGFALILIVLGGWLYSISLVSQGHEYIRLLLGQETIGRMVKAKTHTKPIYYYLEQILLLLLPVTLFFIGKIYVLVKNIKNFRNFDTIEKITLSWVLPNFIFFSLLSGKLAIYLLPILAPAVVLSVSFIDKKYISKRENIFKWILRINLGVLFVISLALPYYNQNYTLEPVVKFLKNKNENVISYRFQDVKNISFEIGKENIEDYPLEEIETVTGKNYVISRNKYSSNLEKLGYSPVLKTKTYSVFLISK